MPRLPMLDGRLACAAALFPACAYGADIGADHGRLSCYLLASGRCERMCVSDISKDSLRKAERLLRLHHLAERADFRVGDGLTALPRPADAIAILGMGGHTLSNILLDGKERLSGACLILSAHTHTPLVRQTLEDMEYHIVRECIVLEKGRCYILLRAEPGKEILTDTQRLIGPRLMEERPELYREYLSWRIGVTECERSENARKELEQMKEEFANAFHGTDDGGAIAPDRSL